MTKELQHIEITDPLTGEIIDAKNIDGLLEAYQRLDTEDKRIYACKCAIREALGALTTGDAKTRRLRGQRFRATVEMPDTNWDQTILKELWHSYPTIRDEYLKIGTLAVKLREFKKMVNEHGPVDFLTFKKMLLSAQKPSTALPRVTIEKAPEEQRFALNEKAIVDQMADDYVGRHGSGGDQPMDDRDIPF